MSLKKILINDLKDNGNRSKATTKLFLKKLNKIRKNDFSVLLLWFEFLMQFLFLKICIAQRVFFIFFSCSLFFQSFLLNKQKNMSRNSLQRYVHL